MTRVSVVVGGQYGSEGKGAVAGFLGRTQGEGDLAIRVAGPNAGHTAYDKDGREWKLRAVPVAAATSATCELYIAAGSEIDLEVLHTELDQLNAAGHEASRRLTIHPSATILEAGHIALEQGSGIVGRIGSTGKGIGAARQSRIARTATLAHEVDQLSRYMTDPGPLPVGDFGHIVIEGTQGYGLGLHTTNYPQVTSSDCRAVDFLAMAGISPWDWDVDQALFEVIVVARTYPIRVAGNSGPMKGETSWEALGLPEELTTVTQKVRRVGEWDGDLLAEAIRANGGGNWSGQVVLALTMADQLFPEVAGMHPQQWSNAARDWLYDVETEMATNIRYVGTGPQTMHEMED